MFRFRLLFLLCYCAAGAVLMGAPLSFARQSNLAPNQTARVNLHVATGIDMLEEQNFAPLRGKRIGLITNQAGVDSSGRRTIDVLFHAPDVKLTALFSPEHGIQGLADSQVENGIDPGTGLPVYSLYGATRRPTPEMLQNVDALVFDIQDAGVRFYTYITTMAYCMEGASKRRIPFFVLDRPDPLNGETIEGPMLDGNRTSFVGYFAMPVRYAMTMGELARMFNIEDKIGADLHVISMKYWDRAMAYGETHLTWIPPSPNLRTLNAAFLYPGIEILQAGGVSVGRGTKSPFEILGAPWIRGDEFSKALNAQGIRGVRFMPAQFTPTDSLYSGQLCEGVTIEITDRKALNSMLMGLEIASALRRMYPARFQIDKMIELLGSQQTIQELKQRSAPAQVVAGWADDLEKFGRMREKYLLYH